MICAGQSVANILDGCLRGNGVDTWVKRITYMQPKHALELGTGEGTTGAAIMSALPEGSRFTTVNHDYPTGFKYGKRLLPWANDDRMVRILASTIDPNTVGRIGGSVDFLLIDTLHEAWHAATELRLFQSVLENGAIVIVDDLHHNDMAQFWDSIPYEKSRDHHVQGVFRYDARIPYHSEFAPLHNCRKDSMACEATGVATIHLIWLPACTGTDWRIACMPEVIGFGAVPPNNARYQLTDNPCAVTCRGCKNTVEYARAMGAYGK